MTHAEEQQAIARAIGQRIQECRELVERLEGGGAVRTQLDKTFEKVAQWCPLAGDCNG